MKDNIYVFEVEVCKWGTDELYKTFHMIGQNLFETTHEATHYVYDGDNGFDIPVQITKVTRVKGIENIVNGDGYFTGEDEEEGENFTGDEPFEWVKNFSPDKIMTFKCSCKEELKVPNVQWPFLICPNCKNKIFRNEVEEIGGIHIYSKLDKK